MGSLANIIGKWSLLADGLFWEGVWDFITGILDGIFWGFCDIFFWLLQIFEMLYKKFAGIHVDGVVVNGERVDGDIMLYLIQSNIIQQMFMSVLILSWFLLIVFTIFAIAKNQYSDKQQPVSKIIGDSFKGLLLHLFVPIAVVVCLMVGNVVLVAIDGATKTNMTGTTGDILFLAGAYNANKLRSGDDDKNVKYLVKMYKAGYLDNIDDELEELGIVDEESAALATPETIETLASIIDENFVEGTFFTSSVHGDGAKWNYGQVSKYYRPSQVSLITIWIGGAFLVWALGKISWGLIARLYNMTISFVLSPAIMAAYPLDGGKALGSWKGDMIKNGTMAFCTVGVLNVLYSIIPFMSSINVFAAGSGGGLVGALIKLFIVIVAFTGASGLISTISGWFGTGDALAEGKKTSDTVNKEVKKRAGQLGNTVKTGIGTFAGISAGVKAAGDNKKKKFFGALMGAYAGSGYKEKVDKTFGINGAYSKGEKAAKDYAKQAYTSKGGAFGLGIEDKDKANEFAGHEIVNKENKTLQQLYTDFVAATEGSPEREILANKIKEKSSWVREAIKDTEEKLAVRETKNQEQVQLMSAFESMERAGQSVLMIAQKVYGKKSVTTAELDLLRSGNVSSLGAAEQGRWQQLGDSFTDADIAFEESRQNIAKLRAADERIDKLITDSKELQGYASAQLTTRKGSKWDDFVEKVKYELGQINAEAKAIRQERYDLAKKDGTIETGLDRQLKNNLDPKEYQKIGKSAGK